MRCPGRASWLLYLRLGFRHIVPEGADHILFVLGLFFLGITWRKLLSQTTVFTVAHATTLFLSTYGIFRLPSRYRGAGDRPLDRIHRDRERGQTAARARAAGHCVWIRAGSRPGFRQQPERHSLSEDRLHGCAAGLQLRRRLGPALCHRLAFLAVGWFRNRPWFRRGSQFRARWPSPPWGCFGASSASLTSLATSGRLAVRVCNILRQQPLFDVRKVKHPARPGPAPDYEQERENADDRIPAAGEPVRERSRAGPLRQASRTRHLPTAEHGGGIRQRSTRGLQTTLFRALHSLLRIFIAHPRLQAVPCLHLALSEGCPLSAMGGKEFRSWVARSYSRYALSRSRLAVSISACADVVTELPQTSRYGRIVRPKRDPGAIDAARSCAETETATRTGIGSVCRGVGSRRVRGLRSQL